MSILRREEIASGVQRIRLGRVNSYLVTRPDGAVLVDSGMPAHGAALLELIAGAELRAILLTHRHLDHAGGAAQIAAQTGAVVVIHQGDARGVRGEERLSPLRPALDPVLGPLVSFLDRRVFRFRSCGDLEAAADGWEGHGFRLVHLPGHTPGHSGYLHLESGVVFAGDAAMIRPDGRPRPPSRLFSRDMEQARRSQRRLAGLDAPLYCFGHGPPLVRGAADLRRLAEAGG